MSESNPLPFKLYDSKKQYLPWLFVAVVLLPVAWGMVSQKDLQDSPQGRTRSAQRVFVFAWCAIPAGIVGIPFLLLKLILPADHLTVSEEGIEYSQMFQTYKYKWSEIARFGLLITDRGRRVEQAHVTFILTPTTSPALQAQRNRRRLKTGYDVKLMHNYGCQGEYLANLLTYYLNQCRTK